MENEFDNLNMVNQPHPQAFYKKPWFYLILAVILIGIIVAIIILANTNNEEPSEPQSGSSSETSSSTEKENSKPTTSNDTLVRNLISDLSSVANKFLQNNNSNESLEQVYDYTFPVYKLASVKTAIPVEKSYGLKSSNSADSTLMYNLSQEFKRSLMAQGYEEYGVVPLFAGITQLYNPKTEIICISQENAIPYTISCGHTSWIAADTIALISSLADAYYKVEEEYPIFISANTNNIKNSPFEPYQRLTASLPGYAGLFYRSSPTAEWVFFTGTQSVIPCEKYEDDLGARRAYQGDVCYDKEIDGNRSVTNGT